MAHLSSTFGTDEIWKSFHFIVIKHIMSGHGPPLNFNGMWNVRHCVCVELVGDVGHTRTIDIRLVYVYILYMNIWFTGCECVCSSYLYVRGFDPTVLASYSLMLRFQTCHAFSVF